MEDSLFVSKITKLSKRHSNIDKKPSITFSNKTMNSHLTQGDNDTKIKEYTKDKKYQTESKVTIENDKNLSLSSSQRSHLKNNEDCNSKNQLTSPKNFMPMLEINYYQCYFCEQFFKIDSHLLDSVTCQHKFCIKCGKLFYEEKIEEGEYRDFKCGVFNCKKIIKIELILSIVSDNHAKILQQRTKKKMNEDKDTEIISYNHNLKKNFNEQKTKGIVFYSSNSVLDVNSNELFYQYSRNKQLICPKCKEMSLYGKNYFHFIKCLNCFCRICKYCLREYSVLHMDATSFDRCKVYFRRDKEQIKQQIKKQNAFCRRYLVSILFILAGYSILFSYFINKAKKSLLMSKYYKVIFFCCYCVLFVCTLPFLIIIIPYYPILTCI